MGRHAHPPAPDPGGASAPRSPLHADLFVPHANDSDPGSRVDGDAFDALVAPHRKALHAYVLRLTDGDEAATDSVVKETFYRASQDPSRLPQRSSAMRPWLVLTARAVLRDGERLAPAGHDDRPLLPRRGERSAAPKPATTIVRALDELSGVHRDILVELFYQGVSLERAAEVRGVPVETVKSRLYFAMRALRVVLDRKVT